MYNKMHLLLLLQRRVILKACNIRQHYIWKKADLISPDVWRLTRDESEALQMSSPLLERPKDQGSCTWTDGFVLQNA